MKGKIFLLILLIAVIASAGVMVLKKDKVSNGEFNKQVKATNAGFVYDAKDKEKVAVREEFKVYEDMHKMANTKVVADAIWGEIDMDEERINKLIIEVLNSEYEDKEKLLAILKNWKNGDFSNCVGEHNYFWTRLNGTVGEATGLK